MSLGISREERVARAIEDSVWLQHGAEIDFALAARAAIAAVEPSPGVSREEIAELLLRLEAMYSHRPDGYQLVNPDRPDAAKVILELMASPDVWEAIDENAPHACHVLAARFDESFGEWIYGVVLSPPSHPFTHWRPLPDPPKVAQDK